MRRSILRLTKTVGLFAALAILRTAFPQTETAHPADAPAQPRRESPFACNALALTPELRKRHFDEVAPALIGLRKSARELPDGYEIEFASDAKTAQLLTEWAIEEHLCCAFLEVEVRFERDGGPLWLRLTGRKGVKEFIASEAAAWIK